MALYSTITQNLPSATQQIIFYNPSEIDNISYASNQITYAAESSFTLSKADMALYYANKLAFYNTLLFNFPVIYQSQFLELPVSLFEIQSLGGPNYLVYTQTSTASPVYHVYTITYDRGSHTATFAARASSITITMQEYLIGFQVLTQFFNQVSLA